MLTSKTFAVLLWSTCHLSTDGHGGKLFRVAEADGAISEHTRLNGAAASTEEHLFRAVSASGTIETFERVSSDQQGFHAGHSASYSFNEDNDDSDQMQFVHRNGEVKLHFDMKQDDSDTGECHLAGTLSDRDDEAGDLNLKFTVTNLWYRVIDANTGTVVYEEKVGPEGAGVETLTIEGDSFVLTHTNKTNDLKDKRAHSIVHIGKQVLLENHETHWQRVINKRGTSWLEEQEEVSRAKFRADLDALLVDAQGNGLLELAVAFSNAGVSGVTYPCAYPLLSLAQNMRSYGKAMSTKTKQDVQDKEDAAAAKNAALLETPGCLGCGGACGNEESKCFGMCGPTCSHWAFVCLEAPRTAFLGCCAHDGYCDCGGVHWEQCWAFHGDCDSTLCARTQCTICTACTGRKYETPIHRRRWYAPRRRRLVEAMGQCQECTRRSGESMQTYLARCFPEA